LHNTLPQNLCFSWIYH